MCPRARSGARSLLESAGLVVDATYKIGDSAITSGFMLGFGAGDFGALHLAEKLLQPVREPIASIGKESRRWGRMADGEVRWGRMRILLVPSGT